MLSEGTQKRDVCFCRSACAGSGKQSYPVVRWQLLSPEEARNRQGSLAVPAEDFWCPSAWWPPYASSVLELSGVETFRAVCFFPRHMMGIGRNGGIYQVEKQTTKQKKKKATEKLLETFATKTPVLSHCYLKWCYIFKYVHRKRCTSLILFVLIIFR